MKTVTFIAGLGIIILISWYLYHLKFESTQPSFTLDEIILIMQEHGKEGVAEECNNRAFREFVDSEVENYSEMTTEYSYYNTGYKNNDDMAECKKNMVECIMLWDNEAAVSYMLKDKDRYQAFISTLKQRSDFTVYNDMRLPDFLTYPYYKVGDIVVIDIGYRKSPKFYKIYLTSVADIKRIAHKKYYDSIAVANKTIDSVKSAKKRSDSIRNDFNQHTNATFVGFNPIVYYSEYAIDGGRVDIPHNSRLFVHEYSRDRILCDYIVDDDKINSAWFVESDVKVDSTQSSSTQSP